MAFFILFALWDKFNNLQLFHLLLRPYVICLGPQQGIDIGR